MSESDFVSKICERIYDYQEHNGAPDFAVVSTGLLDLLHGHPHFYDRCIEPRTLYNAARKIIGSPAPRKRIIGDFDSTSVITTEEAFRIINPRYIERASTIIWPLILFQKGLFGRVKRLQAYEMHELS